MSRDLTKVELIAHKDAALMKLDKTIKKYIDSSDHKMTCKADILSFWIEQYSDYLFSEGLFIPQKLKRYERGDVIQINLGFRVGSEQGGLHYAVVLDNNNAVNSSIITVIPLSSKKETDTITKYDIDLGGDIYTKMKLKNDTLLTSTRKKLEELKKDLVELTNTTKNQDESLDESEMVKQLEARYNININTVKRDINTLEKMKKQIARMKEGSIALVGQITTISKMKIYNPKGAQDTLSGIKLSPTDMDEISNKMKELYFHNFIKKS